MLNAAAPRHSTRILILIVALAGLPMSAHALDAVLIIQGTAGNSYTGAMGGPGVSTGSDVRAFSLDVENQLDFDGLVIGADRGYDNSKASFRLVKPVDDASILLVSNPLAPLTGSSSIAGVEIRVLIGGVEYRYEFNQVFVTSVRMTGSLDDPLEEIEFTPCAVRITNPGSTPPTISWDFVTHQSVFPSSCL